MNASPLSSRTLIASTIVVVVSLFTAGTLVAYQRERKARPASTAATLTESSIPQLTLEEVERDFRSPALVRRYRGQLVDVTGVVAWTQVAEDQGGSSKPKFLVYLSPEQGEEAVVCCALSSDSPPSLRVGETVVVQGKVGVIAYEGPQKVGLVGARILHRGE